jgi:DNA (cytosine-5)-methyltransferase 1
MSRLYEFFAGGGMASVGLGRHAVFANDLCPKKASAYRANFGAESLRVCDIGALSAADLPGHAALAWASSPCQDVSVAGAGAGITGSRSGALFEFMRLMRELRLEGRAPRVVCIENVLGITKSLDVVGAELMAAGYGRFGAVAIDAELFVPHSRPRLFIVAVAGSPCLPTALYRSGPNDLWHPTALQRAVKRLPEDRAAAWVWWTLPTPPTRNVRLIDIIEAAPSGVRWNTPAETQNLLRMLSSLNRSKVDAAMRSGRRMIGAGYRRIRPDGAGSKVQRFEARFDGIAGCLRTPTGGSSRQVIIDVEAAEVRTRLISARETARLMGLPDGYRLPESYNEAYHLTGDGVAVPAVRYLAEHLLEPILAGPQGIIAA